MMRKVNTTGSSPQHRRESPDDRLACQKVEKGSVIPKDAARTRPTCFISVVYSERSHSFKTKYISLILRLGLRKSFFLT